MMTDKNRSFFYMVQFLDLLCDRFEVKPAAIQVDREECVITVAKPAGELCNSRFSSGDFTSFCEANDLAGVIFFEKRANFGVSVPYVIFSLAPKNWVPERDDPYYPKD